MNYYLPITVNGWKVVANFFDKHFNMKAFTNKCNMSIRFINWSNFKLAMYILKTIFNKS